MWLPSCLASFTVGLAVVTPSTTHVWRAAAISLRQLRFVIFQTGNPNASSYRMQIPHEIPRLEPRPSLAQANQGFFQVRVVADVYRPWEIFNVLPFLLEPLRVGAGLEDLQEQSVNVQPPPTVLAVSRGLFLD